MAAKKSDSVIELPPLRLQTIELTLIGDSPLICHAWSEKAKRQMLEKQMKKAAQAKAAKDPEQDYRDSLYPFPGGGYGFPNIGFKASAVDACSHVADITKVLARGAFHIDGELTKIHGEPSMREDMVRVGMGTADIRYRGQFVDWRVTLMVKINLAVLSPEQVINLFNVAGFAVGVGEWRPQRDGSYGRFHVAAESEL